MNLHLVPYVQELGYPITVAAVAVSARGFIGFVSNPFWGFLTERAPVQWVGVAAFLMAAAAMAIFLVPSTEISLATALLVFGFASTGFYTLSDVIWANFFGRISLGTVRGIAYPIPAAFSAIGPLIVGLLYDFTGSYQVAWVMLLGAFVVAAGLILLARRPQPRQ
jgi:MFS family permease